MCLGFFLSLGSCRSNKRTHTATATRRLPTLQQTKKEQNLSERPERKKRLLFSTTKEGAEFSLMHSSLSTAPAQTKKEQNFFINVYICLQLFLTSLHSSTRFVKEMEADLSRAKEVICEAEEAIRTICQAGNQVQNVVKSLEELCQQVASIKQASYELTILGFRMSYDMDLSPFLPSSFLI